MTKPKYTETVIEVKERLSVLETHIPHIENHLCNIDQHMNKLNERTTENEICGKNNASNIKRIFWIIGGLVVIAGIVTSIVIT